MAQQKETDRVLVNNCTFATARRPDGSTYPFRAYDCGSSTCKWSDNYAPKRRNKCNEADVCDSVEQ
ncbi:hypothetical protein GGR51DRAFT_560582 [Nemania sp. FL0031]|nr:hypothetical protein GGR51DRAFT_560582 [Nemania sp. FL0031]